MNQMRYYTLQQIKRFCSINEPTERGVLRKRLVPDSPFRSKIDSQKLPQKTTINADTIALLERLSLVDCANKQGIETLEAAIEFANQIQLVDTSEVEPLITVLEDIPLRLRQDEAHDGNYKQDILKNAIISEEDYFVAPPGNIPLEAREDLLFEKEELKSSNKK